MSVIWMVYDPSGGPSLSTIDDVKMAAIRPLPPMKVRMQNIRDDPTQLHDWKTEWHMAIDLMDTQQHADLCHRLITRCIARTFWHA